MALFPCERSLTAPYHPATNGGAERAVGIFKNALKSAMGEFDLYKFLMMYRSTPHATTERSPSELMLGRGLRTKLSLLKPNLLETVATKQDSMVRASKPVTRSLDENTNVLARDYRRGEKSQSGRKVRSWKEWDPSIIKSRWMVLSGKDILIS